MENPNNLNKTGEIIKKKLDGYRESKHTNIGNQWWRDVIECEGAIRALETLWYDLHHEGLIYEIESEDIKDLKSLSWLLLSL